MPIKTQKDLPAKAILEHENIFVMDEERADHQDIRPIEIGILNLMPLKEDTELQMMRTLSNTAIQVNLSLFVIKGHESKNTSLSHLNRFYETFDEFKHKNYDGLIITGAPIELMEFEEVDYWDELTQILDWAETHVTTTFFQCWGAQAAMYYHYGIKKRILDHKVFGVFNHKVKNRKIPLVRGFDDEFYAPHSRNTDMDEDAIRACDDLIILAESDEVGIYLAISKDHSKIFCFGHSEYDRLTLDKEYKRDLEKGLDIAIPKNYYPNDDVTKRPLLSWRSHCNALYSNYLNYYVYQMTPYDINWLPKDKR